jgi:chromosome segregation protein
VGTRAYSIIEQGRVGLIVSAKPEDRRALLEEAAGISKYKSRRRAAERKMEHTQQNLVRVADIVGELEKRIDSLARQAKKAEKYKALRAEMREMELHHASHRFLELHAEAKVLQARIENLSADEWEILEKVRGLEEGIGGQRAELERHAEEIQSLAAQAQSLESQIQLHEQNLSHWRKDREETTARGGAASAEREALAARIVQLREGAAARERELESLGGTWKEDEVAMQVAQEERRRVSSLHDELSRRLEAEQKGLVELASRLANHENNLINLARQRADLEARRARVLADADSLRSEELRSDRAREDVARRVDETRQLAAELAERRGAEEAALVRARQEFAENEIRVIALREELADKRSRLASLREIQRNYEGFDRGVRAVMLRAGEKAREMGILGLVADVVSTSPRYEKALEAALGERLQHVVVESRDNGIALAEYLKTYAEGRSTFLPVHALCGGRSVAADGYPIGGESSAWPARRSGAANRSGPWWTCSWARWCSPRICPPRAPSPTPTAAA